MTAAVIRTRRHRRAYRARTKHGRAAAARHNHPHGRTGAVHKKKTPAKGGEPQHSSSGGPGTSSVESFAVRRAADDQD